MPLFFVTGNAGKLRELQSVIDGVQQLDLDLPEIQALDAEVIIRAKLAEARRQRPEVELIVEDTSLHLHCLNGLPGPLIKWFLKTIGADGLHELAQRLGNDRAEARTFIGHADAAGEVTFFEGSVSGRIVSPRGGGGFGWDQVFQPDGHDKTFAEMTPDEKNTISMRRIAIEKFRAYRKTLLRT